MYFYGKFQGKRSGCYGGFLLGCYDPDQEEYQTICKIGTGFSDEVLQKHYNTLSPEASTKPKPYYAYDPSLTPDVWFAPFQVWEVKCADLSVSPVHKAAVGIVDSDRGISLRLVCLSCCSVLVEDDCDKICDGGWKERPYAWNPVG
jgi:DNA ligase-1